MGRSSRWSVCAVALAWASGCCPLGSQGNGWTRTGPHNTSAGALIASRAPHVPESAQAEAPIATTRPSIPNPVELGPRACHRALRRTHIPHRKLDRGKSVAIPVRLAGAPHGVEFRSLSGRATFEVMDCRLAVAMGAWAKRLKALGITKVEHFSAFRPGARVAGSGKESGHARALALDAAKFHLRDGRVLDVKNDWDQRELGGDVCPTRRDESPDSALLRRAVCEAIAMGIFQMVLTPHYDRAHHNHVHLELVPDVDWTYIH